MTWSARKHKYNAKRTVYRGVTYSSKMEADYAAHLDRMKAAKSIKERVKSWEPQVTFKFIVNGERVCNYRCDFEVTFADGRVEYHETKGVRTKAWVIKEKLFRILYPELTLVVVGSRTPAKTSRRQPRSK